MFERRKHRLYYLSPLCDNNIMTIGAETARKLNCKSLRDNTLDNRPRTKRTEQINFRTQAELFERVDFVCFIARATRYL